jgi:predicted ABC-type ATPase
MENKATFVYEGHFTNDATWDIPKKFKAAGYKLNLIFLGLKHPDLSEIRVLRRVKQGGHFVDRRTIEDNFYGNLEKLNIYFPIINNLQIIDSSQAEHLLIASFQNGENDFAIPKNQIPVWFSTYLPALYSKIQS